MSTMLLEQMEGKVRLAYPLTISLIECDDPSGTVRKLLELSFQGEAGDDKRMVIGDIQMTGTIDKEVGKRVFALSNLKLIDDPCVQYMCRYGQAPGDMYGLFNLHRSISYG